MVSLSEAYWILRFLRNGAAHLKPVHDRVYALQLVRVGGLVLQDFQDLHLDCLEDALAFLLAC